MQIEHRAAASCGRPVPVVQCGIGRGAIDRAFAQIDAMPIRPRHAVLFGIAGGLREPCDRETAWVIDRVVDASTGASLNAPTASLATASRLATVAHADTIVSTPSDRAAFARRTNAQLVDMECWAFAHAALSRGMQWTIVRGVSDGPLDTLPLAILDLIDERGNPKIASAAAAVLRQPSLGKALVTLNARSTRALDLARTLLTDMLDAVDSSVVPCSAAHPCVLFGGTFDPPHRRHIGMLAQACDQLHASTGVVIPAAMNPLKSEQSAGALDRWDMVHAALRDPTLPRCSAALLASRVEVDRAGPSFTIDTARALLPSLTNSSAHDPQAVRLLMGSDAFERFEAWRSWRELLELVTPAIVARAPHTLEQAGDLVMRCRERWGRVDGADWLLPIAPIDMSSTRSRARAGEGVTPGVAHLIRARGLYRKPDANHAAS